MGEAKLCDECDGSGEYLIDGKPQVCICVGETRPYQKLMEKVEELGARVKELEAERSTLIDDLDLARDEFARIAVYSDGNDEIKGLAERGQKKIVQHVPVIKQRDNAEAERDRLRVQLGAVRPLVQQILKKRELEQCWFVDAEGDTGDCSYGDHCNPHCPLYQLAELVR